MKKKKIIKLIEKAVMFISGIAIFYSTRKLEVEGDILNIFSKGDLMLFYTISILALFFGLKGLINNKLKGEKEE